jgi:hypothetical protein
MFAIVRCLMFGLAGLVCAGWVRAASFGEDLRFLREHVKDVVVLRQGDAQVAVVPSLQGRVMTSTVAGDDGDSLGWINRDLIGAGELQPHINAFGGEDRFWLGPEGGQFSIFFPPGADFDLEHWQTPAPIDSEPYALIDQSATQATFRHEMRLTNYSRAEFTLRLDRAIRLLSADAAWQALGTPADARIQLVAFESVNRITNLGARAWRKETGLLSVWILGMFPPSPATTIVVPIRSGPDPQLGPRVNSDYFGAVPSSRLRADDDLVFFSGDGRFRSKIGISPRRSRPVLGSYDASRKLLTIVQYTLPEGVTDYVNSSWQIQQQPFAGDVVNSYNDGPPSPGAPQLGPFYELESSSPAAALDSGQSLVHVHRTFHLTGDTATLSRIATAVLGASIDRIEHALTDR